jgi:hypothetical protein
MVFFLEITNIWQKSRDLGWFADFFLEIFKIRALVTTIPYFSKTTPALGVLQYRTDFVCATRNFCFAALSFLYNYIQNSSPAA